MRNFAWLLVIIATSILASIATLACLGRLNIGETPIHIYREGINKDVVIIATGEDIQLQGYDDPKSRILFIKKANIIAVKEK